MEKVNSIKAYKILSKVQGITDDEAQELANCFNATSNLVTKENLIELKLDLKLTMMRYFYIIILAIILMNPKVMDFIGKLSGFIK